MIFEIIDINGKTLTLEADEDDAEAAILNRVGFTGDEVLFELDWDEYAAHAGYKYPNFYTSREVVEICLECTRTDVYFNSYIYITEQLKSGEVIIRNNHAFFVSSLPSRAARKRDKRRCKFSLARLLIVLSKLKQLEYLGTIKHQNPRA